MDPTPPLVARVVVDVTGLDKQFDYLVPDSLCGRVAIGSMVRVELHGRRVGGWVVAVGPADGSVPLAKLKPLAKWSGIGPSAEAIELARWASVRWGAGRLRPFMVAASPTTMVTSLPAPTLRVTGAEGSLPRLVRLPPAADQLAIIEESLRLGPVLVIHPSVDEARRLAARLRHDGRSVALHPDQWAQAAAGVDVVIGGRGAVWWPRVSTSSIVVLDEHDEGLQEERSPTWHARDVAIERARRAGVPCMLVSPCPTAAALHWAGASIRRPSVSDEREGWPILELVDRTREEPWKRSLLTSPLIQLLRGHGRIVCVQNTKGRARLLACRTCRALQRCERCNAAVRQDDSGSLVCGRCDTVRPVVCQACGSGALSLHPARGQSSPRGDRGCRQPSGRPRHRRERVAARLRSLDRYRGSSASRRPCRCRRLPRSRRRVVGTAIPSGRTGHGLAGASRRGWSAGGTGEGGSSCRPSCRVTRCCRPCLHADPARAAKVELARRELLGLPPFAALAAVSGGGAGEFASATGLESLIVR